METRGGCLPGEGALVARKSYPGGFFFPRLPSGDYNVGGNVRNSRSPLGTLAASAGGRMPKTAVWLIIIFTLLFILGINTGDLDYLNNLGNTI